MNRIFSTDSVHPRDRFDFWHSVACANIVDHQARPECRTDFNAEIEVGSLGCLELLRFQASPMEVSHVPTAESPGADFLVVCQQISGALQMEHDARIAHLAPGDIMIMDPLLPHAGRFSSAPKMLAMRIPRREFEARVGSARNMIARVVKPLKPENRLASTFIATLPDLAGTMSPADCDMIANHAMDLIALSLTKSLNSERPRVSNSNSMIFSNVRSVIESRLSDEKLDTETVAAEIGLSIRYINQILSHHDTSVARLIQSRRLERCRLALEDPGQTNRTVSEIAYGWGFVDLTHFGRRFKRAYDVSPREYRELAKQRG